MPTLTPVTRGTVTLGFNFGSSTSYYTYPGSTTYPGLTLYPGEYVVVGLPALTLTPHTGDSRSTSGHSPGPLTGTAVVAGSLTGAAASRGSLTAAAATSGSLTATPATTGSRTATPLTPTPL